MKSLYCPWLQDHWKLTLCSAIMAGSGYALYKTKWSQCKRTKTPAKVDNPYESIKLLNEYLAFNYGGPSVNCMFDESVPNRALDIGCAVGGASFTLASKFDDVIGIDYSHGFVKTCNALKETGSMEYDVIVEGELTTKHTATIPDHLPRTRCTFQQGDACNLPLDLGTFGCVLAANLICRLPNPTDFIMRLNTLVAPGGILVIFSPYTFLQEYTRKENWLGGFIDSGGKEIRAFDRLQSLLRPHFTLVHTADFPFLIRETYRKHQWTVSHATVWRRNVS